eukprot:Skav217779  [mRNA]  locus=scaffold1782:118939:119329:- [translate_table: standard]
MTAYETQQLAGAAADFRYSSTGGLRFIVNCLGKGGGAEHSSVMVLGRSKEILSLDHAEDTSKVLLNEVSKSDCQELTLVRVAEESQEIWDKGCNV